MDLQSLISRIQNFIVKNAVFLFLGFVAFLLLRSEIMGCSYDWDQLSLDTPFVQTKNYIQGVKLLG
jgi:hypothetical protein